MKPQSLVSQILMPFLLVLMSACHAFLPQNNEGPKKYKIPWFDQNAQYSLQDVEINTLKDPILMEGDYAKIKVGSGDGAQKPVAKYAQGGNGTYIPLDTLTAQMVTIYAHMERLGQLEDRMGLSHLLSRPRLVTLNTKVIDPVSGAELQDNATYIGDLDIISIVPTTLETLPISMNGGILAHEQFHAIFQHLVLQKLDTAIYNSSLSSITDNWSEEEALPDLSTKDSENPPAEDDNPDAVRYYNNAILMKALNEGLADYWGWLYTGDANFIGKSLPSEKKRRVITQEIQRIPSTEWFWRLFQVNPAVFSRVRAYQLGNIYARYLRALSELIGKEKVAQRLLTGLPRISKVWNENQQHRRLNPAIILNIVYAQPADVTPKECCLMARLINTDELTESYGQVCSAQQVSACEE